MLREISSCTFALAGNPNSGKTTLFNELTGSHYEVGNWSGVTVERKEGTCKYVYHCHDTRFDTHEHESVHKHNEKHNHIKIVDLPGIYSLYPYSAEEVITRDYITSGAPDLILNIVDATNLERNLYLTTQLAEAGLPMVIALNMMDALEANGVTIDTDALEKALGIPVFPISANKGTGIQDLVTEALETAERKMPSNAPVKFGSAEQHIAKLHSMGLSRLQCTALLEGEELDGVPKAARLEARELSGNSDYSDKFPAIRYSFIRHTAAACKKKTGENHQRKRTEAIDRFLMHPLFAIPAFIAIMFAVFQITFGPIGSRLCDYIDILFNDKFSALADSLLLKAGASGFSRSLVTDGIIAGVGGVVTFFPQIMLLFLFLSFLEDSGYMARTAFIMDKLFMRFGLSGKSFVPMIMGFGCTVPAVMSARTLDNERDRRLTILLTPFMSCGAKMPVYAVITSALFPHSAGIVIFSLYFIGIILGICSGLVFSKTLLKGDTPPFILELPPYRMPTLKSTFQHMWDKAKDFAVRAGTILLAASIIIWFMQNLSFSFRPVDSASESMIGRLGKLLAPIFAPCGFGNPDAAIGILSGIAAKEAVVTSLSVMNADISAMFTPLSAYCFLLFILLYTPCVAAVSTIRRELNSRRLAVFSVIYQISLAWLLSAAVFQAANLF